MLHPGLTFRDGTRTGSGGTGQWPNRRWRWSNLEPMTGIEPAYSAWEAISSAERPFYRGCSRALSADPNPEDTCVFGTFGTLSQFGAGAGVIRWRSGYARGTARQFGRERQP